MTDLLWITVPAGLSGDGFAVVRVLVIPRLDGASTKAAGLASWPPPGLAGASLEVLVDDETSAGPQVIPKPLQIRAQPGLWSAFFGGDIPVKAAAQKRKLPLEVRDVSATADAVAVTLANVAATRVASESQDRSEISRAVDAELRTRWMHAADEDRTAVVNRGRTPEPPDFNKIIGLLREHPTVLEALGLIFELPLGIRPPQRGRIKVSVKNVAAGMVPPSVAPWTRFAAAFRPTGDDGSLAAGMVALDQREVGNDGVLRPAWQLVSFDVAGAAGRLRQAAQALAPNAAADRRERSLPTLRTLGISFVRRGRQNEFDRRLNRSNASLTDGTELDAEQVLLGYRFDVKPENENRWFSLHRRTADYRVARAGTSLQIGLGPVSEEGHVKPAAAVDLGDGVLRADEAVARWDGWSLSVPKPTISSSTQPPSGTRSPAAPPYDFTFSFSVDGRLPRLRFSQSYRFRARLVDVAGGGLRADDPNADRAFTDTFTYLRFEPINVPILSIPAGDGLGPAENSDLVVTRSDVDLSVEDFEAGNPQYRTPKIRLIEPPRAPLMLAEHHGAFDSVDSERSWQWVEASFLRNDSGTDPLLPDFAVVGLTVFPRTELGAPPSSQQPRAWTEAWPDLRAKRLVLGERNGSQPVLSWESDAQGIDTLVVRLAQAECLSLELSCQPKGNFVDHFAAQVEMPLESRKAVRAGRHPLVNPVRTVRLVHAVRRPLREPRGTLVAKRAPGQTTVNLVPNLPLLNVDPNSTSQLDLAAVDLDAAGAGAPSVVQSIAIDRGDTALREQLRHELGDTKHRRLQYSANAYSRFRDFFAENDTGFVATGDLGIVNVPNSARPPALSIRSVRPAFVWKEEVPTGDEIVRRRRLGGILRVELDGPWNLTGEGEQLAVVTWLDGNPPTDVWPHLTQVGRDPIFRTHYPNRFPAPALFTTTGQIASVALPEAGTNVAVVPYDAVQDGGIWHVDIAVPGILEFSYSPFIRLAMARYQPNSIDGFALSPVVFSELVQPFPDRLLVVRRAGPGLKVLLSGTPPLGSTSRFDSFVVVEVQQLQPADADINTALSAQAPTDLAVAAWVSNHSFARSVPIFEEVDIQLPPASGPMRLKITETDKRRFSPDVNPSLAPLNARTTYLDLVNL